MTMYNPMLAWFLQDIRDWRKSTYLGTGQLKQIAAAKEIERLNTENERLRKAEIALLDIARQKLTEEIEDIGDIEYGYNEIIRVARAAVKPMNAHNPDPGCFCPACKQHYSLYARLGRGAVNYEDLREAFTHGWVHATADPKRGLRTAEEVWEIYRKLFECESTEGDDNV